MKMLMLGVIALLVGVAGGAFVGGNEVKGEIIAAQEQAKADSLASLAVDESGHAADAHAGAVEPTDDASARTVDEAPGEASHAGTGDPVPATSETLPVEAETHAVLDSTSHEAGAEEAEGAEGTVGSSPLSVPQAQPQALATPPVDLNKGAEKLASIFEAMRPKDAAAVLQEMEDAEVKSILAFMSDRKAAGIIGAMSPERAAVLSRVVLAAGSGN